MQGKESSHFSLMFVIKKSNRCVFYISCGDHSSKMSISKPSMLVKLAKVERLKDKKPQNNAVICHIIQDDDDNERLGTNSEVDNLSSVPWHNKRKIGKPSSKISAKKADSPSRNSTSNKTVLKENSSLESENKGDLSIANEIGSDASEESEDGEEPHETHKYRIEKLLSLSEAKITKSTTYEDTLLTKIPGENDSILVCSKEMDKATKDWLSRKIQECKCTSMRRKFKHAWNK